MSTSNRWDVIYGVEAFELLKDRLHAAKKLRECEDPETRGLTWLAETGNQLDGSTMSSDDRCEGGCKIEFDRAAGRYQCSGCGALPRPAGGFSKVSDRRTAVGQDVRCAGVAGGVSEGVGGTGRGDARTDVVGERERRLADEIENQRRIYRPGTDEAVLRRAALNALMERGER